MSFNQNTKINNLYQIVSPIIDIQDVSGSLLPDVSNNYNYSNNLTLQGVPSTYDYIQLGTISKPVDFTTTLSTNFYMRITGQANFLSAGFMDGGAWIKDNTGTTIAILNIGNDRDSLGLFDISNNTVVNVSPSQFPLSVQEYVYYPGWAIFGNATTFTCNVVMTPDYPNYYPAYYSPLINKIGYSTSTIPTPTPSIPTYTYTGTRYFYASNITASTIYGFYENYVLSSSFSYGYNLASTSLLTSSLSSSQRVGGDAFLCPTALSNIKGYINLNYSDANVPNNTMTIRIYKVSMINSFISFAQNAVQLFTSSFPFTPGANTSIVVDVSGASINQNDLVYVAVLFGTSSVPMTYSTRFGIRYTLNLS